MNSAHVRAALRYRREALGWSQARVAEALGTSQSHVSDLEGGVIDSRLETFVRWADALGFDLKISLRERVRAQ